MGTGGGRGVTSDDLQASTGLLRQKTRKLGRRGSPVTPASAQGYTEHKRLFLAVFGLYQVSVVPGRVCPSCSSLRAPRSS